MDDQKNSTVYDGKEHCGTAPLLVVIVWFVLMSSAVNGRSSYARPLNRPSVDDRTPSGYDTWSWGKGAKTCRIDSPFTSAVEQKAAKQRHFISVIDEGVYQRGVFKRLGKRKKVGLGQPVRVGAFPSCTAVHTGEGPQYAPPSPQSTNHH